MNRSLLTRFLLIFALLFAQTGSLAHSITHILAEKSQGSEQSLPHDKYCDQCAAYAQIGGLIGSSAISFAAGEHFATPEINDPVSHTSITFVAFAARAPPYSA